MYFRLLSLSLVLCTFFLLPTIFYAQDKNQTDLIEPEKKQENSYSGLSTPQEIDKLSGVFYLSQTEHYTASIFSGFLAGGTIGLLSSLALFSNDKSANNINLITFSVTASAIGALSGFFIAFSESFYEQQFHLGKSFLQFEFYSAIGVSLIGLVAGSIVYVFDSSKNINFLAQGAGYGALVGTLVGFILYFSLGKHIIIPKNVTISSPLKKHGVVISYVF